MINRDVRPRPASSLEQIPGRVRAELRLLRARSLGGGGTPAQVYLCEDDDRKAVVVKVLHAEAGLVDGHDLGAFLHKPQQIERIHRELPGLSRYYVPLLGHWQGAGWGAYAMPRADGVSSVTLLHGAEQGTEPFLATLASVFTVLGAHGYSHSVVAGRPGYGAEIHLDRVARRLPLLASQLGAVTDDVGLRINGQPVPSVHALLRRAAAHPEVLAAIEPPRLYYPVHGDLNLGNVLVRAAAATGAAGAGTAQFTILDPRGILEHWDPVYDAAKALFSLTLFEAAMSGGFEVVRGKDSHSYDVRLRRPVPAYRSAAAQLLATLMTVPFFRDLSRTDPLWPRRLLYSHAFHVVAEAACRLSDHTVREFPGASGLAARRELALGLFLSGLVLLDNLLAGPADPETDPVAHLGCLAAINRPGMGSASEWRRGLGLTGEACSD